MGRKQPIQGKHLFLYTAVWAGVMVLLTACSGLRMIGKHPQETPLVMQHLKKQEFHQALAVNEVQLQKSMDLHRDSILFQRGIIYCHPLNPAPDPELARTIFQRILKGYPDSNYVPASQIMVSHLNRITRQDKAVSDLKSELEDSRSKLSRETVRGKKRTALLKKAQQKAALQKEQYQQLKSQLEKLKNVDLGIEEKKREMNPD